MSDWQPISTAPRDGTRVDLWGINHAHYAKKGYRKCDVSWGPVTDWLGRERDDWRHGMGEEFEPTHWMPLPQPPGGGAMSDDLIERLRNFTEDDAYATPWTFGEVVREAADELTRLRAEVERLTAALADERAHADALAEALARIAYQNVHSDTFPRVAFEAYSKHRARRQG